MKTKILLLSLLCFCITFNITYAQKAGDTKYSYVESDHSGWFKLDGRAISSLPADAQQIAASLGYTGNLPDATNRLLKTSNSVPFKALGGLNTQTLLQAHLPNVNLNGSTSQNGDHSHQQGSEALYNLFGGGKFIAGRTYVSGPYRSMIYQNTSTNGNHAHSFTTSSLNGNVAQIPLDIENAFINVNTFIYLQATNDINSLDEVATTPFVVANDNDGKLSKISVTNLLKNVSAADADWFSSSTGLPSTDINSDIYTMGKVGIGTIIPQTLLHLEIKDTENGLKITNDSTGKSANFLLVGGSKEVLAVGGVNNSLNEILIGRSTLEGIDDAFKGISISSSDKVGINTRIPTELLDINGNARIRQLPIADSLFTKKIVAKSDGTLGVKDDVQPSITITNELALRNNILKSTVNGISTQVDLSGLTSNSGGSSGGGDSLWTKNGDNINYTFGHVSIGTSAVKPDGKLTVDGKIWAEEVEIVESVVAGAYKSKPTSWADYVFDANYDLMDLDKLRAYIKENKHLPKVPSSEEVAKNGIELTNISVKLLEKIEELTLYTLEKDSEIKELKAMLEVLKNRLDQLENK